MSGTAFRGVSSASDSRFPDKDKKLMNSMNFPKDYATKVDLKKVNWEVMKTWIAGRVTELLGGVEDDVLIGFVFGQFEGQSTVDPRQVQISLTGFLEKNTSLFMKELWLLLASAAENQSGIPQKLLDDQAAKIAQKKEMQEKINERLERERKNRQIEREEEHRKEEKRRHEARREREKAQAKKMKEEEERYQRKRAAEREEREKRYEEQRKADKARDEQRRAEREKERKRRDRSEERLSDRTAKRNSSPVPVGENGSKRSRKEEDESIAEDPGSPKLKKVKKEKKEKKEKKDKREKKEKKEKKSKKEKKDQNEESGSGSEQSQGQKLSLEDELRQKALLSIKKE